MDYRKRATAQHRLIVHAAINCKYGDYTLNENIGKQKNKTIKLRHAP